MSSSPEEAAVSLSPETERLFSSARDGLAPTEADRARNFAALVERLGPVAVAATIPNAGKNAAGTTGAASISAKAALSGIAVVVVGAALLGVFLAGRSSKRIELDASLDVAPTGAKTTAVEASPRDAREMREEPAETSGIPSNELSAPSTGGSGTPSEGAVTPPPASAKPTVKRSAARAVAPSAGNDPDVTARKQRLREEVDLVSRMQTALQSGNTDRVHALAREYAQRFPEGALAPEVSATDTMASCAASPKSANAELQRFESRFPHSPLLARVRSACAK